MRGMPRAPAESSGFFVAFLVSTRRGEQKDTASPPLSAPSAFSSLTSPAADAARQRRACSGTRHGVKLLLRRPFFMHLLLSSLWRCQSEQQNTGIGAEPRLLTPRRRAEMRRSAVQRRRSAGLGVRRRQEGSGWEHPALRRLAALTREDPSAWLPLCNPPLWRPAQISWMLQGAPQPAQGENA